MKTLTVLGLVLLLVSPWYAFAQKEPENLIKNGDFEKFTGDNPDLWDTSNIPGTLTVVSASKQAHSGQRAVKCEVKDFGGTLVAGYACQKNMQTGGKDLHLKGAFLMRSIEKDQGALILCFVNSGGSTVGTMEEYVDDTKSKFIELDKDVKPPAGTSAVHLRLTIFPDKSSEKTHVGSYVVCDDLRLTTVAPAPPKEKPPVQ
jgi:hypothetical protein